MTPLKIKKAWRHPAPVGSGFCRLRGDLL